MKREIVFSNQTNLIFFHKATISYVAPTLLIKGVSSVRHVSVRHLHDTDTHDYIQMSFFQITITPMCQCLVCAS